MAYREVLSVEIRESMNTPAARAAISSRLDYRVVDERPASMSVLALFWPQPALALRTDPLDAARDHAAPPNVERLLEWARGRVEPLVGPAGGTSSTTSAAWYWFAPVRAERGGALASALLEAPRSSLAEALAGAAAEHAPPDVPRALDAHVEQLLSALAGWTPESERPADLLATSALLGVGAPGNIAWRALNRLGQADDRVTEGDPRVRLAESVRAARCDAAPRQRVREPKERARGRCCVLAQGRSLLHRRGAPGRP